MCRCELFYIYMCKYVDVNLHMWLYNTFRSDFIFNLFEGFTAFFNPKIYIRSKGFVSVGSTTKIYERTHTYTHVPAHISTYPSQPRAARDVGYILTGILLVCIENLSSITDDFTKDKCLPYDLLIAK